MTAAPASIQNQSSIPLSYILTTANGVQSVPLNNSQVQILNMYYDYNLSQVVFIHS